MKLLDTSFDNYRYTKQVYPCKCHGNANSWQSIYPSEQKAAHLIRF